MEHPFNDKIDLYFKNQLSKTEAEELIAQIQTDPQMMEEFELRKLEHLGMELSLEEDLKNKLISWKNEGNDTKVKSLNRAKRGNGRFLIAAAVALMIAASLWVFVSGSNSLYQSYYTQDPGLPTVMGTEDQYEFYRGMVDYKAGNYQEALNLWNELEDPSIPIDELNYYKAMSYLGIRNAKEAKELLKPIADQSASQYYSDANYYVGLIELKRKDKQAAIKHLSKSDHELAKKLLVKLEGQ